jgi:hypothetical protein
MIQRIALLLGGITAVGILGFALVRGGLPALGAPGDDDRSTPMLAGTGAPPSVETVETVYITAPRPAGLADGAIPEGSVGLSGDNDYDDDDDDYDDDDDGYDDDGYGDDADDGADHDDDDDHDSDHHEREHADEDDD